MVVSIKCDLEDIVGKCSGWATFFVTLLLIAENTGTLFLS